MRLLQFGLLCKQITVLLQGVNYPQTGRLGSGK